MTEQNSDKSMKSIYVLGLPINITLEMLIQLISLVIPAFLIKISLNTASIWLVSIALLVSLYLYSFAVLMLGAVITKFIPKPSLGIIESSIDEFKYQTLIALNTFVRRTPARWLMNIPFPGSLFYRVCGAKIDNTALVTFSDSLPDPYFVSIGKNSLLGWGCLILGHYAPTPSTLFLGKVDIGDNVLIGAEAIVWPNVKIGSNATVQNKAVVVPGTIIPSNEIWGGVPAKKIRDIEIDTIEKKLPNEESVKLFIFNLTTNLLNKDNDLDLPLLSNGFSATQIARILNKLESHYKIFLDRTEIEIESLSINKLLTIIKNNNCY